MLKYRRYVYAVYREKSFSKAAESLHISQPALSTAIRKLESQLQLQLFDRSSSPVMPTEAGKYYIASIERILAIEEEMRGDFERMVREQRTEIRIGAPSFFCSYVLPELIGEFRQEHPEAAIHLLEANAGEFSGLFQAGVLDLCLTVDPLEGELDSCLWKQEEVILAVPAENPVVRKRQAECLSFEQIRSGLYRDPQIPAVGLASFRETPFLLLKKGNDLHNRAEQMCRRAGFSPQVAMYLDQMLTSYYVACSGKGAAFLRPDLVQYVEPTSQLCFFKLEDPLVTRDIRIYTARKQLPDLARRFRQFLLDNGEGNE